MATLRIDQAANVAQTLFFEKSPAQKPAASSSTDKTSLQFLTRGSGGISQSAYGVNQDKIYTSQQADQFVQDNKDLLSLIDGDSTGNARQLLSKREISSRDDLLSVVAEAARDQLSPNAKNDISQQKLEERPQLAGMILQNTGGIRDLINSDRDVSKLFSKDAPKTEQSLYNRLAKKAAGLFKAGTQLSDEKFYQSRPKVADELLHDPTLVKYLNDSAYGASRQTSFVRKVASSGYEALFNSQVASRATSLSQSGEFNAAFFAAERNRPFAEYVAAGEHTTELPQPHQYLHDHPELHLQNKATADNFDFQEAIHAITAQQAHSLFASNFPGDNDFFHNNIDVSRLAIENTNFRAQLGSSKGAASLDRVLNGGRSGEISTQTLATAKQQFRAAYADPTRNISIMV